MKTTSLDLVKACLGDILIDLSGELRASCDRLDADKMRMDDALDAIIELELDLSDGKWDAELQEAIDHE